MGSDAREEKEAPTLSFNTLKYRVIPAPGHTAQKRLIINTARKSRVKAGAACDGCGVGIINSKKTRCDNCGGETCIACMQVKKEGLFCQRC